MMANERNSSGSSPAPSRVQLELLPDAFLRTTSSFPARFRVRFPAVTVTRQKRINRPSRTRCVFSENREVAPITMRGATAARFPAKPGTAPQVNPVSWMFS